MYCDATVFVVDDHQAFRESLRSLIDSVGLRSEGFGSAQEFLARYDADRPGCVVLDVRMPGMSGLELYEQLKRCVPAPAVIFVSGHGDVPMAVRAVRGGAVSFLEKPLNEQELIDSIHEAIDRDAAARKEHAERAAVVQRLAALTTREREVLDGIVAGKANKLMAAQLGISIRNVEYHRARLMRKMQAESLSELLRLVLAAKQHTA